MLMLVPKWRGVKRARKDAEALLTWIKAVTSVLLCTTANCVVLGVTLVASCCYNCMSCRGTRSLGGQHTSLRAEMCRGNRGFSS